MMNLTGKISDRCDPGIRKLVTLDFYDGVESGIAFDGAGNAAYFKALGDSNSGLFRAFILSTIQHMVHEISPSLVKFDDEKIVFFSPDEFAELQAKIEPVDVVEQYLAVGSPYMDWLAGLAASDRQIDIAKNEGFKYVHRLLKNFNS